MATVLLTFTEAWLTDVANPTVSVHASFPDRASTDALDGAVRFYAGGRRRVITTPRETHTFPLTLQLVTDADVALLTSWRGRVLLLRDGAGRRVFVTFLSLALEDFNVTGGTLHHATMVLTELTFSEAV